MKSVVIKLLISGSCFLSASSAMAKLPFMADLAGQRELPKPFGVSVDYFHMEQGYQLERLDFEFPGLMVGNPADLDINSEAEYVDLKFDAWVLPFLNAFILIGDLDGSTEVTLSDAQVPGLPIPLNDLKIEIEGTVLGGGITLAYSDERWFGSITASYTDADVNGLFATSVESFSVQPRLGMRHQTFAVWLSAMYLEVTERHKGMIGLGVPNIPNVTFDLSLQPKADFNYGIGASFSLTEHLEAKVEFGFSDRNHQLLSLTYRY